MGGGIYTIFVWVGVGKLKKKKHPWPGGIDWGGGAKTLNISDN